MNHVKSSNRRSGFTLIELLLSMSFIAILLLAIATVIIQISQTYNHGLTLKEVNEISRTVSDDLTNDVSAAAPFSLGAQDGHYVNPNPLGQAGSGNSPSGRLCLGSYSYIWNYGWALDADNSGLTVYSGTIDTTPIRLVRVPDPTGAYCLVDGDGNLIKTTVDPANATELIGDSDHDLAIQQLSVQTNTTTASDPVTSEQLYTISFTIGTNNQAALTTDANNNVICKPPSLAGADLTYCAEQQFSLVARAQHAVN